MKITKQRFLLWNDAYVLREGAAEMIVVAGIGPRILSLRVTGGENLLFVDRTAKVARGAWKIYGGHRVWLGPEAESTYAADNAPCAVSVRRGEIMIEAPADPRTKLQKALAISGRAGRFHVRSIVRNTGSMLVSGGVWALTCIRPDAKVFFPWGRPGAWQVKKICYWQTWGGAHATNIASRQWQPGNDLFVIDPTGEEGKVGTAGHEGWIGATFPAARATFIKQFAYRADGVYADDGCAIECYTCAKFIELETLGPQQTLHPGESICHAETWTVRAALANPRAPGRVRQMLAAAG